MNIAIDSLFYKKAADFSWIFLDFRLNYIILESLIHIGNTKRNMLVLVLVLGG